MLYNNYTVMPAHSSNLEDIEFIDINYGLDRSTGYTATLTFTNLPDNLLTGFEVQRAISQALQNDEYHVIVETFGPEAPLSDEIFRRIYEGYLTAAAWLSVDDKGAGTFMQSGNFDEQARTHALGELKDFLELASVDVREFLSTNQPEQLGHDFFLTRNRHGAGFWDRGLGDLGQRLTEASHTYGETNYYVDEIGNITSY